MNQPLECEHCHRKFTTNWQKQAHQLSYQAVGKLCPQNP